MMRAVKGDSREYGRTAGSVQRTIGGIKSRYGVGKDGWV